MDNELASGYKVHQGRNVKRFRQIIGIKQEALAEKLNISPSVLSRYEQKESIDQDVLEKVAKALNLPLAVLRDFSEEATMNIIANTFTENEVVGGGMHNGTFMFNQAEKIVELYSQKEKLQNDKIELLEQMLKSEKEKVAALEDIIKKAK